MKGEAICPYGLGVEKLDEEGVGLETLKLVGCLCCFGTSEKYQFLSHYPIGSQKQHSTAIRAKIQGKDIKKVLIFRVDDGDLARRGKVGKENYLDDVEQLRSLLLEIINEVEILQYPMESKIVVESGNYRIESLK